MSYANFLSQQRDSSDIKMDFFQLTEAQRRGMDTDGFLVIPQAIDAETVAGMTEAADRIMASFTDDPKRGYLQLREGIVQEEAFDPLISNPATVSRVVQLLSPNIHLHTASLLYKKPQPPDTTPASRGWHRDIGIAEDLGHQGLPRIGIKVCYCLTDFPEPDSGMTLMARGSHLNGGPLAIPKGEPDPPTVVDPCLRAGDAVLFENRTFHTAAPNLSDSTSKAIIYGYAYRWMKVDVNLDPPDERVLERVDDDIDRQLLGAYRDVDTSSQALIDWAEHYGVSPERMPWVVEV